MPRLPMISGKDYIKFLEKYGCTIVSIRGSHYKMYNPETNKTAPIAIHARKDVGKGAFSSTLNQLGINVDDFLKLCNKNY